MNFDFSALNFETIDSNINAYPDMFLNQNGVTFTKKVLEDLGYPAFVLCLLDAKARVFAIRSCKSNEPKGFKFSKPRGEQKGVVTISNKNLLDPLRAVTGEDWIPGKPPERESHLSLFSLAAAMETVENRKRFTHCSHSLRSPSFSSPAFSLYREKCPFFVPRAYSYRDG